MSKYTVELVDNTINVEMINGAVSTGASQFTALTDTPSAYTGQAGKFTVVNTAEDALEFRAVSAEPAGADTEIQYNNNGAFGASSDFVYNSGKLGVGISPATTLHINGGTSGGIITERTDNSFVSFRNSGSEAGRITLANQLTGSKLVLQTKEDGGSVRDVLQVGESGIISSFITNYKDLVLNNNDIPNKKYVDDLFLNRPEVTLGFDNCDYICDGVDDHTQINSAINYLHGIGGGTIKMKYNTGYSGGRIFIHSNIRIVADPGTVYTAKDGANTNLWTSASASQLSKNIILENIRIEGNAANNVGIYQCISIEKGENIVLENVEVNDSSNHGIVLKDVDRVKVENCTGTNCDKGLFFVGDVKNIMVYAGAYNDNRHDGISLQSPDWGRTTENGTISGVELARNLYDGIAVSQKSRAIKVLGCHIHDNILSGATMSNDCNNTIIQGNTIHHNLHRGVYMNGAYNSSLTGNIIFNNSRENTTGDYSGVFMMDGTSGQISQRNLLTNNSIYDDNSTRGSDLSATASSGQKVVSLDSADSLRAGQWLEISDSTSQSEEVQIDTIDYVADEITLVNNLVNTYNFTNTPSVVGKATQGHGLQITGNSDYNVDAGNIMYGHVHQNRAVVGDNNEFVVGSKLVVEPLKTAGSFPVNYKNVFVDTDNGKLFSQDIGGASISPTLSGDTIDIDCSLYNFFDVYLDRNVTRINLPTGAVLGSDYKIQIRQDGTGGRAIEWGNYISNTGLTCNITKLTNPNIEIEITAGTFDWANLTAVTSNRSRLYISGFSQNSMNIGGVEVISFNETASTITISNPFFDSVVGATGETNITINYENNFYYFDEMSDNWIAQMPYNNSFFNFSTFDGTRFMTAKLGSFTGENKHKTKVRIAEELADDFISGSDNGLLEWYESSSNGAINISTTGVRDDHFGEIYIRLNNGATSARTYMSLGRDMFRLGNSRMAIEGIISFNAGSYHSFADIGVKYYFGWTDTASNWNSTTDGAYFEIVSDGTKGRVYCVLEIANIRTVYDTGIDLLVSNYISLKVLVPSFGTTVVFLINDISVYTGDMTNVGITTNMTCGYGQYYSGTALTNHRYWYTDAFSIKYRMNEDRI